LEKLSGAPVFPLSAAAGKGVDAVLGELLQRIPPRLAKAPAVVEPDPEWAP